jgi:hypothetical protein
VPGVSDLLAEATAELYDADPEEFTQLRQALVAQAREQGQPAIAKRIGVLRKPTRSAWVVNRLARAHPEAATRLAEMASELRAGGDGARIRELTQARGRLVDELAREAFAAAGTPSPPAALREDVIATLNAALADPEVAADLAAGTLTRAAHWAGFGLVPLAGDAAPAGSSGGDARQAGAGRQAGAAKPATSEDGAATARADELDGRRRQRERILEAERGLAEATGAAEAASATERELEDTVRRLEADLEDARQRLADARRRAYRAHVRQERATAELDRIRK